MASSIFLRSFSARFSSSSGCVAECDGFFFFALSPCAAEAILIAAAAMAHSAKARRARVPLYALPIGRGAITSPRCARPGVDLGPALTV